MLTKETVQVTTNSSGAATVYSNRMTGRVVYVRYIKTDFDDGVDFTITTESSGQTIWTDTNINAAETVYPLRAASDTAGAEIAGAYSRVEFYEERISIVIASGGDTKFGAFELLIDTTE